MKRNLLILLTFLLILTNTVNSQTHWNFADDFSNTQGSSNWYVLEHWGSYQGTEMNFDAANNKWVGSEQYLSATPTTMHPGNTKDVMIKWIAPFDTRISISGTINKTTTGGDGIMFIMTTDPASDWHIPLLEYDISGTDLSVKTIDRSIWVNEGDAIYFYIKKKDNLSYDSANLDISIDAEPFTDIAWSDVDHSDPSINGSIAWYIVNNGDERTYRLNTGNVYLISDYLELPERVSLISASNTEYAQIQYEQNDIDAPETDYREQMMKMNNESSIKGLDLNAKAVSMLLLRATDKKYIRIENSYLHNTRNNYKTYSTILSPRPHIIYLSGSEYCIIANNKIENAGIYSTPGEDPKIYPDLWPEQGRSEGIMISDNHYTAVIGNEVKNVLGHGIVIGLNSHYLIENNSVTNTGLNHLYSSYPNYTGNNVGDGIGGYHHETLTDLWFVIRNNTVYNSMNHGIHVGGNYIKLENNHVSNSHNIGIFLDDWRTPTTYSSYCQISNNYVDSSNLVEATYTHDIYIGYGCHRTNSVFNNIVDDGSHNLWIASEKDFCDDTPADITPTANFFGLPDTICVNEEVHFFDQSENNPIEWLWNFGDGVDTCNLQNPKHIYSSVGEYNISLTVTNIEGSNSIELTNNIIVVSPTSITYQPENIFAQQGDNVNFTVNASGTNLNYAWYFNNTAIANSNSNTLNLVDIDNYNVGDYYVQITGGCEIVYSDTVVLDINTTNANIINEDFLNINPNPANNYIHVSGSFSNNDIIQIIDITGKIVKELTIHNSNNFSIDIAELNSGIYYLRTSALSCLFIKK